MHGYCLILESGARIDVTGKGYTGGICKNKKCYQGYSYDYKIHKPKCSNVDVNYSGGGCDYNGDRGGAGGSYATNGQDWRLEIPYFNSYRTSRSGSVATTTRTTRTKANSTISNTSVGMTNSRPQPKPKPKSKRTFGDATLKEIYLGSGGGGYYCHNILSKDVSVNGTNGGGVIIIKCKHKIVIENNAFITANGENNTQSEKAGCGSGGSIYLKAPTIVNNGTISALGGVNKRGTRNKHGAGGDGRIRIDCNQHSCDLLKPQNNKQILPKIGFFRVL